MLCVNMFGLLGILGSQDGWRRGASGSSLELYPSLHSKGRRVASTVSDNVIVTGSGLESYWMHKKVLTSVSGIQLHSKNIVLLMWRLISERIVITVFSNHPQNDSIQFSCSVVSSSLQPHGLQHARLPCPSQLLELAQTHVIESVMPSNYLILSRPFLLLLSSVFPSIRVFSNE